MYNLLPLFRINGETLIYCKMKEKIDLMIPEEIILSKIYFVRGIKVMLDMDLAELYGIETKYLKRAVRRNRMRFPEDFMFEFTPDELQDWRCQFGTSNREKLGIRIPPFAFTEHGVLMLASILNSTRARQVNIQIVRIFIRLREMLMTNKHIIEQLRQFEKSLADHDDKIRLIFDYLEQLEQAKLEKQDFRERNLIGFKKR